MTPRPEHHATPRTRTAPRARAGAALCAVLAVLTAGCGVRATSVPVDAGAAPSRVACVLPEGGAEDASNAGTERAHVYLVCSGRVSAVDRHVDLPEGGSPAERADAARTLLTALQAAPDSGEESAGFTTDVPRDLRIAKPRAGDPERTLRLSAPPRELPAFALAQLVCTFADSPLGGSERTVVLAGPGEAHDADAAPARYTCDTELRTDGDAAKTAGTPV
ncbi:hypothetical protein [Streptomyces sp. HNM0574]|uniref:hypothetical protein n=1 Tax=Streptomyces sp. HNM0574 TaxID=2714954 RepID=UPI00146C8FEB|nr:hypothetical protein [Streptomyces sp. HNM0574]NLU66744.1 hypothetical protein [Streptomyces sp. HNM0574]